MGFSNPLVGGGGSLVYPSIHSPDYKPGISGWSINRDGSAEFDDLVIRGTFDGTDFEINSAGVFFYDGTPALGNLITAMASQAGVDRFGNAYFAGFLQQQAGGVVQALLSQGLLSISQATLPGASVTPVGFFTGNIAINGDTGVITRDSWHAMGFAAAGGWANSGTGPAAQYRLTPENELELIGDISGGSIANGTILNTALTGTYQPAKPQRRPVVTIGNTASPVTTPRIQVLTNGLIEIFGIPAGTTEIEYHCFIPLDA